MKYPWSHLKDQRPPFRKTCLDTDYGFKRGNPFVMLWGRMTVYFNGNEISGIALFDKQLRPTTHQASDGSDPDLGLTQ